MLRKLVIGGLLALVLAAPASGAPRVLLMPGVTYERQFDLTPHGPVAVNVLTAPRPGGLYGLGTALSNDAISGRERLTAIERRVSPAATVAGVNGDLFSASGEPAGIVLRGGLLDHAPNAGRSSIGLDAGGSLQVQRIEYDGIWRGNAGRRPLQLNRPPGPNGIALFTRAWGGRTPSARGAVEAVLPTLPPTAPNADLSATVSQIVSSNGGTAIPRGGGVILARGTAATRFAAEAPAGTNLFIRFILTPTWSGVTDAIGGGPLLVRGGKPVFRANEVFSPALLAPRRPRTAVGQLADGRIVLVAIDGGSAGYSVGVTNFELSLILVRLGAVTGAALGSGTATTMAFDGTLLDHPSAPGGELPISDALLVSYSGVYALPPLAAVLSPNGDAVDERQTLSYKVVRPSTVTATLVGPGGVTRDAGSGVRAPGTYRFDWNGTNPDGSQAPEGRWRFSVSAVDDLGRRSSAERTFGVDETLGFLRVPATVTVRRGGSSLRASFVLAHPAQVTVAVERPGGAVVRTLFRRRLDVGTVPVGWNGRDGRRSLAFPGRYVLRVTATNELGAVSLAGLFRVRRG
ncbi:MAG TPA: phosphodiester glycosidase family protein [Gaiellaceae bacterium]|nr:phosphodiester glycosidase family protein [Gaiellaceae bacterium]